MSSDAYARYTICNIYYDTDDYKLIRASIEKPIYKEKLRVRSYGVPDKDSKVFVELKKKYEGVVYKRRLFTAPALVPAVLQGMHSGAENRQVCNEIAYFQHFHGVKPKVFIAYDRQAFHGNENSALRITFDTALRYRTDHLDLREGDYGKPILDSDNILMEIKIPGACPQWLSEILAEYKIFPRSFSKYGTCYREHILKNDKNLFVKEMRYSA